MKEITLDGLWKLRADKIEDNKFGIKENMEWDMTLPGDVHGTLIKNKATEELGDFSGCAHTCDLLL